MEPSRAPPVIIVGAGLVGLILSQALSARSIPYLIYEQDPHASHRGVGWGLTIHWALEIFKSLVPASIVQSLPDAFVDPEAVRSGEKGNFLFYDLRNGVALWKVPPSERLRLRRQAFRQLLLQNINVQWGKQVTGIDAVGDNQISAHFADSTSSPAGSIIVGCDGARSQVRKLLMPHSFQNYQLPIRLLGVSVVFSAAMAKPLRDLDPYFMQGGDKETDVFLWFSFLDGPSNNTRDERDSYTCQVLISWPVRPEKGLPEVPTTSADRLALMKHLSRDWADPFHTIIKAIPDDAEPITLRLEDWPPPVDPRKNGWDNMGGRVTLAGDSAHAMTM
jgi:2-polyprenyl-6-methoxyphenol hydroxylase-like FAD-dependent oxidoreductase